MTVFWFTMGVAPLLALSLSRLEKQVAVGTGVAVCLVFGLIAVRRLVLASGADKHVFAGIYATICEP